MKTLWIIPVLATVAACSVSAPITGKFSTGEAISGVATGGLDGGTVQIKSATGFSCSGNYNAASEAREMSIPLSCDQGKTGLAQVTRNADLMGGKGTFELNDGRKGTFSFQVEY